MDGTLEGREEKINQFNVDSSVTVVGTRRRAWYQSGARRGTNSYFAGKVWLGRGQDTMCQIKQLKLGLETVRESS